MASIGGPQRVKVGTWSEIAQALSISVRKAQELRHVLPIFYVGKTPFAYLDELEAWVRDNKARVDPRRRPAIAEISKCREETACTADSHEEDQNPSSIPAETRVKPEERAGKQGQTNLVSRWRRAAAAMVVLVLAGVVLALWSHGTRASEAGAAKSDVERSRMVFAQAYDRFVAGDLTRAVDLLNKAEQLDGKNAEVLRLRGFCLRTLGSERRGDPGSK